MGEVAGPSERDALMTLLEFQVAAGVDLALDETPHDRFAEAVPAAGGRAAPPPPGLPAASAPPRPPEADFRLEAPPPARPSVVTAPTEVAAADARERARSARDLRELEALVAAFDGCALKATAKQIAFADGTPGARVMILGEAPGAEEDRTGRPFVGRGGQLLDRMLAAIGLDRGGVYIANVVPWRPPGNRTPTPQEIAVCLPFTHRQIELARPEILLTVGSPATQALLGTREGITKMRGRWSDHVVGETRIRVLPMLHPAYLLRQPLHKRLAWRDLQTLARALAEPDSREPLPPNGS